MRNIHFSFLIIISVALLLTEAQNVSCYVLKLQLIVVSIKRNVRDIPKDVTQTGNGARRKWTQNMEKKKQRIDHGLLLSKVFCSQFASLSKCLFPDIHKLFRICGSGCSEEKSSVVPNPHPKQY